MFLFPESYFDDQSSIADVSDISLEEYLDKDNTNIFSDPESEWNPKLKSDIQQMNITDSRPESDQPKESVFNRPYKIPVMSYESLDDI